MHSPLIEEAIEDEVVTNKKEITLEEYIATNTLSLKDLKNIYYIQTPSYQDALLNPRVQSANKRNVGVLILTDPIDEYMTQMLHTYKEYALTNLSAPDTILPESSEDASAKEQAEQANTDHKDYLEFVRVSVGENILEKVEFGTDMAESIAILQTPAGQPTAQMIKMYKAMGQELPLSKKTLILNPNHPFLTSLMNDYITDASDTKVLNKTHYIYEQAAMLDGSGIESMSAFIQRVNGLIA